MFCHNVNQTCRDVVLKWYYTFLHFRLFITGATEKVFPFLIQQNLLCKINFGFTKQKCIFEHYRQVKTI